MGGGPLTQVAVVETIGQRQPAAGQASFQPLDRVEGRGKHRLQPGQFQHGSVEIHVDRHAEELPFGKRLVRRGPRIRTLIDQRRGLPDDCWVGQRQPIHCEARAERCLGPPCARFVGIRRGLRIDRHDPSLVTRDNRKARCRRLTLARHRFGNDERVVRRNLSRQRAARVAVIHVLATDR